MLLYCHPICSFKCVLQQWSHSEILIKNFLTLPELSSVLGCNATKSTATLCILRSLILAHVQRIILPCTVLFHDSKIALKIKRSFTGYYCFAPSSVSEWECGLLSLAFCLAIVFSCLVPRKKNIVSSTNVGILW